MSGAETYKLVAMFMGGARLDMHDQGWWVMHDHLECKFHVTRAPPDRVVVASKGTHDDLRRSSHALLGAPLPQPRFKGTLS